MRSNTRMSTSTDATAPTTSGEIRIGSLPLNDAPAAINGTRAYPPAVDLTEAEARRCLDAQTQGMDLGVRFEGERLVCFGLRRGVVARDCAEIYEPVPVDDTGIVRLRRTGRIRVSAPMAEALTGRCPTAPPPPTLTASPVPDTRHAPRAGRRVRSTRRSAVRASPSDDGDPPAIAEARVDGDVADALLVDPARANPLELHADGSVHRAEEGAPGSRARLRDAKQEPQFAVVYVPVEQRADGGRNDRRLLREIGDVILRLTERKAGAGR
jgi:hypothetical protein